ncbi:MAG TPA: succinate dehydrogenase, cytochrome b556 subunit [Steroidobacteraceae bacterium]|nr:succinate dehydrogenase, cytochrome b556 subunit [Steroidobacteraceae bacterium]HQW08740.1 succinate dehydrogenase, cytochrome b556 subunit [Steroidobacteraceae bacterium]HQX77702.1 succinate dehydrogenase, cytochrome b556 subunit [Steroidobacteraceae bacterium]HQZ79944.1 succinate dehydrogenase, cytochrome b556 subunit [Steroidobacteraceae bacterium]
MRPRPLSPHVTVYRFQYTMIGSFTHRMTGVAMSAGLLVLAVWLVAAANGADAYAGATAVLSSLPCKVLLALWLLAFCYHLFNGIRHLAWDLLYGFERREARRSYRVVIAAALVLFCALAWLFFARAGAVP